MDIACNVTERGLELRIDERSFALNFPDEVWQAYADKALLADNFAFLKSLQLPELLDRWEPLNFDTSYPLFKHQLQAVMMKDVMASADADGRSISDIVRRFMALDFRFRDHDIRFPDARPALSERAILNMSFGKDSLLTYAVARELGIPTTLVMSIENDSPIEFGYKQDIARRFSEEFNEKIWLIENNTGVIHRYQYWGTPQTRSGFGHIITEYLLDTVPFAFHQGARYILMGNEQSCSDSYITRDGYLCYPVFDQSSEWLLEMSKMASVLANDRMYVSSLIEPLHDIAITRILHTRYPEIGKYQMSCFPDDNEHGKKHFWCAHCSKCARVYVYMQANGIDPAGIGLGTDMFSAGFEELYSVFGENRIPGKTVGYDATPCGRDEQLFAFYLVAQRGMRRALVDLFRERHMDEALARKDELESTFMRVNPARSIPTPWLERVTALYAEALSV